MPATSDRLDKLQKMLEKAPGDAFLLYGIALEYKKLGEPALALAFLGRTIGADAGYCYAYFQQGQVHEAAGDVESAKRAYRAGVDAARAKGDAHALSEIEGALSMLA